MENLKTQNVDSASFPAAQISSSKDKKSRKSWNNEKRGLRCKFHSLITGIQSLQEHITELKKRLNKGKKSSLPQPDNQPKADQCVPQDDALTSAQAPGPIVKVQTKMGLTNSTWPSDEGLRCSSGQQQLAGLHSEAQKRSAMTSASTSHGASVSPVIFGSAPPKHATCVAAKLPSKQQSCNQMPSYSLAGNIHVDFSHTAFVVPQSQLKRKRSDMSPARDAKKHTQVLISRAFGKLQDACCDFMPSIRKHLDGPAAVPLLSVEERAVIADFSTNQAFAEMFLEEILLRIKRERVGMRHELLQSLCRVYVALCKEANDPYKAHALAYKLLKEDYPEAPKVILLMVTVWPNIWTHDVGPLCEVIHTVSREKARGEVLTHLSRLLHWEERPPGDIPAMLTSILTALTGDSSLRFKKNSWFGDDICQAGWGYVFSLDLLCTQMGWEWTYDNIISKELWPALNVWLNQPRAQQGPVRDACLAAVFRLLGRLGQLGLKKNPPMLVQSLFEGINMILTHGLSEGISWEVQLALVYAIHDLAPSNLRQALRALTSWERKAMQPVPPAVTGCIRQIRSLMS